MQRIGFHARAESASNGPERTLAESDGAGALDLGAAALEAGQAVVFEVCAGDAFPPERWLGAVAFEVWHAGDGERVSTSPLDEARLARVRRGEHGGCL
ncbi:MAG: hypothetical protein H5U40_00940, partial [Polyangiaceae bacterium]|nr:hypothetical protein [Polyangiaceae bacterium]